MRIATRVWAAGVAVLALGIGILSGVSGKAADDKGLDDKAIKAAVQKIADAMQKGDMAAAKTGAAALAKNIEDIHEVMDTLGKRKATAEGVIKGGIGVGEKPGDIIPDNIELYLLKQGRDAPGQAALNKEAAAMERAAYVAAAVLEVALAKPPTKNDGAKTIELWNSSATAARTGALELAKAAASKSPAAVKEAATKVNRNCTNCHSEFKGAG